LLKPRPHTRYSQFLKRILILSLILHLGSLKLALDTFGDYYRDILWPICPQGVVDWSLLRSLCHYSFSGYQLQISWRQLWSILVSRRVKLNVSREHHSTAANSNDKPQHCWEHYISWPHPWGCHRYCPDNYKRQHNKHYYSAPRQLRLSSACNILLCWIECNCKFYLTAILFTSTTIFNHFFQSTRQHFRSVQYFLRVAWPLRLFLWMGYYFVPRPNYLQSSRSFGECLGGSGN